MFVSKITLISLVLGLGLWQVFSLIATTFKEDNPFRMFTRDRMADFGRYIVMIHQKTMDNETTDNAIAVFTIFIMAIQALAFASLASFSAEVFGPSSALYVFVLGVILLSAISKMYNMFSYKEYVHRINSERRMWMYGC